MRNSRKGFTLAEVLVTLAIIGVVAALTIPTLIQSTTNAKYQTSFKKDIAVLNQVIMSLSADGTSIQASNSTTGTLLATLFATKLNVLKQTGATLWLADGTKLGFTGVAATGCSATAPANPFTLATPSNCYVIIDVNGDKAPNDVSTPTSLSDVYEAGISTNVVVPINATDALLASTRFTQVAAGGATLAGTDAYIDTTIPLDASIVTITQ